jgi:hypothetical protein
MSLRLAAATALLVLAAASPAVAQDVVGTPQIDIGEAAAVGGSVIRDGAATIGTLDVERVGDQITVKATFTRKPPGRRASLCLKVDGERQCVHRAAKRNLKLTLDRSAPFTSALRATVRSGDARGTVRL